MLSSFENNASWEYAILVSFAWYCWNTSVMSLHFMLLVVIHICKVPVLHILLLLLSISYCSLFYCLWDDSLIILVHCLFMIFYYVRRNLSTSHRIRLRMHASVMCVCVCLLGVRLCREWVVCRIHYIGHGTEIKDRMYCSRLYYN